MLNTIRKRDFNKLEAYVLQLSKHGIPACDIVVWENHDLVYRTMAGYSDYKENDITIYHLLTMTSGFGYDVDESPSFQKLMKETNGEAGTVEVMSCFANDLFYFSPGERWRYSKSHDVLGAVIEVVSGMRLGVYLKKHIMEPLGI